MDFNDYQASAQQTDRTGSGERAHAISHFGLIGEIGSLLTVFKKRLRDQSAYASFQEDLIEEMGDVLWYLANICSRYDISLDRVAQQNIAKISELWGTNDEQSSFRLSFDERYDESEQLPRQFEAEFREEITNCGQEIVRVYIDGSPVGDPLTDNAYDDDGYRYHDVFHISYAVYLGWSPLLRKILGRKRKSNPRVDEIEDGARARIAEEAISLFVYGYAYDHSYLEGVDTIDTYVLRGIKTLSDGLEVESVPMFLWKHAILDGYRVFRQLRTQKGGLVRANLLEPSLTIVQDPA